MVMAMAISDQDWEDESFTTAIDEQPESVFKGAPMREMGVSTSDVDGNEDSDVEALTLPESTYSFLFTESTGSAPFVFGLGIAAMSYMCLVLALINNLQLDSIPTNVDLSVRIAQYLSILIALLMEEEIPTGLYLLRRISRPYLLKIFPKISYHKFVFSSVLRITMGYLFLVNVLIVLIHADTVIEIFYDVLALQFIQKLDDIGFSVSKMEVLGKRLQRATTTPYFHVNFQKEKESLGLKWRVRMFLKAVYFINFAIFLAAMIVVSTRQTSGYYQCESVSVKFGDKVWEDAIVQWPEDSVQYPPGLIEEMVLVFSYFDGMYTKDPHRTHENRPVYVEQKKSDRTPFDETAPLYDPYHMALATLIRDSIKPAEIKYCGGYWIFSHDYIRRSRKDKSDETCAWLARSPKTAGFDLVVDGKWQIWAGVILEADVTARCNTCSDDIECNLNGVCNGSSGKCDCDVDDDVVYLGSHCEVQLTEECRTIIGERYNDTWSVDVTGFSDKASAWMRESGETHQEYSRPVYTYVEGLPSKLAPEEGDSFSLIYSGSRWFRITLQGARGETASEFWAWQTANYHAFWARAYSPGVTTLVSEPSDNDSPVGVDFYFVGEGGNQFGAFGALYPAQLNNITGRGVYRCNVEICSFCTDGITIDVDYVIPDDFVSLRATGYTCGFFIGYAPQLEEGSIVCHELQMTEQVCCPP